MLPLTSYSYIYMYIHIYSLLLFFIINLNLYIYYYRVLFTHLERYKGLPPLFQEVGNSVLQGGIIGFNVMGCEGRKELDRFEAREKTRKLRHF